MQIRVYTEEAWNSYPHYICGCWGEDHGPTWITQDQLIEVLERAALPGIEFETYIIASEETIRKSKEYEAERLKRVATAPPAEPGIIYTM